jgi:putative ABC transport system substrate-binding protein
MQKFDRWSRRALVMSLSAAALAPFAASAQERGRIYRLGAMVPTERQSPAAAAFFDEMRLFGFVEGQNLIVLPNGFGVRNDELAEHAEAVVNAAPDAIISGPDNYTRALQQLTRTIPLIAMTEDMLREGLVASMARPGGNATGISLLSPELDGKRQDILIEAVPGLRKLATLVDATTTSQSHLDDLQDAARRRNIEMLALKAAKREEVVPALEAAKAAGAQALNLLASPLFAIASRPFLERIIALRLPSIHQWPELAEDGGLIGYGPRFTQTYRQRARIVARILHGAKPADTPVEQPTNFELVINLQTAKAIGHEVPAGLVLRADKVIE